MAKQGDWQDALIERLQAERDRLREALKRIAIAHATAEHLQRIAREALGPGESA